MDDFRLDIASLQNLVSHLFEQQPTGSFPEASFPILETRCAQLRWKLKFAWWYASRWNADHAGASREDVANVVLELLHRKSTVAVVRESLAAGLAAEGLLEAMNPGGEWTATDTRWHARDCMLLRGYYALRHVLRTVTANQTLTAKEVLTESPFDAVSSYLLHIASVPVRITVMENLFMLMFLKHSHLKDDCQSANSNGPYAFSRAQATHLVDVLQRCLHATAGHGRATHRCDRLQQQVSEALERLAALIPSDGRATATVKADAEVTHAEPRFMSRMLAHPQSLLHINLKQSRYEACRCLLRFFTMAPTCASVVDVAVLFDRAKEQLATAGPGELDARRIADGLASSTSIQVCGCY